MVKAQQLFANPNAGIKERAEAVRVVDLASPTMIVNDPFIGNNTGANPFSADASKGMFGTDPTKDPFSPRR